MSLSLPIDVQVPSEQDELMLEFPKPASAAQWIPHLLTGLSEDSSMNLAHSDITIEQ